MANVEVTAASPTRAAGARGDGKRGLLDVSAGGTGRIWDGLHVGQEVQRRVKDDSGFWCEDRKEGMSAP